jgi:hypothetical protein
LVLDRRSGYRVYYRLTASSSLDHKLLFKYLQSAFKRDKLFAADLKQLKDAIKEGACTVSELRPDSLSARSGQQTHLTR